jgi:5-methyltetrahydrofolate--homocysteine methyltransferase
MNILRQLSEGLQAGDTSRVAELTRSALEQRCEPKKILDDGLIAGMAVIGEKFKAHEIFLPDVLLAAKAMYAGLDLLKPLLEGEEIPSVGKVVIGTVKGDIHDIGKNLVGIMLKGAGFEVIDLGKDVPPDRFIEAALETGADVIGMSTLLTTTMPVMKEVVDLARERGIQGKVKIIVGGAPLSDDYARKIGADAYGFDGMNAVERIKSFIAAA